MTLAQLITNHAADAAAAADWSAVAAILNAKIVRPPAAGRLTSAAAVLALLGADAEDALAKLSATHTGRMGVQKLATVGLDFSHPLTVRLIQGTPGLKAGVSDKLLTIGQTVTSLANDAGLSAEDCSPHACRDAWLAARLAARIINATALAGERITIVQTADEQVAVWAKCWEDGV